MQRILMAMLKMLHFSLRRPGLATASVLLLRHELITIDNVSLVFTPFIEILGHTWLLRMDLVFLTDMSSLERLPHDIIRNILFPKLNDVDLFILRCVSRALRNSISHYAPDIAEIPRLKLYHDCAFQGSISRLKWLSEQGIPIPPSACDAAASGNRKEGLEWLLSCGFIPSRNSFQEAIRAGNFALLPWMERFIDITAEELDLALRAGHLPTVTWILDTRLQLWDTIDTSSAIASGNKELIQWLAKRNNYVYSWRFDSKKY